MGITLNYQFIPIGDYCAGLFNVLMLFFFGGIFLLLIFIINSINLYKKIKYKQKFDFIPTFIFIFFSLTLYGLIKNDHNKFWSKQTLIGRIENEHETTNGILKLYENGTFEVTMRYVDYSCTHIGDYEINNDTINLKRKDLENETKRYFTTKYIILKKEERMKPLNREFKEIEIIK